MAMNAIQEVSDSDETECKQLGLPSDLSRLSCGSICSLRNMASAVRRDRVSCVSDASSLSPVRSIMSVPSPSRRAHRESADGGAGASFCTRSFDARGSCSFFSSDGRHLMSPATSVVQSPQRGASRQHDGEEDLDIRDAEREGFSPCHQPTVPRTSLVFDISTPQDRARGPRAARSPNPYLDTIEESRYFADLNELQRRDQEISRKEHAQSESASALQQQHDALRLKRHCLSVMREELETCRTSFLIDQIHAADVELMSKEKALTEREQFLTTRQDQVHSQQEEMKEMKQDLENRERRDAIQREAWVHAVAEREARLKRREAGIAGREADMGLQLDALTQTPLWRDAASLLPSRPRWLSLAFYLTMILLSTVACLFTMQWLPNSFSDLIVRPSSPAPTAMPPSQKMHRCRRYSRLMQRSLNSSSPDRIRTTSPGNSSVTRAEAMDPPLAHPERPVKYTRIGASMGAVCGGFTWLVVQRALR